MRNFLILLMVIAIGFGVKKSLEGGGFGSHPLLVNPYPANSPLYEANQSFVDRVNANPEILALFEGVESEDALADAWDDALQSGARALPGDRLVAVTTAQVKVMARLPDASCAKVIRPHDPFDPKLRADIRSAMERLPPHYHQVMADFAYDALEAKANDAPAIPVDKQELGYAMQWLGDQYSGEFGVRLSGVMRNPAKASDEDACWAGNSLLNAATQLSPAPAEALLRRIIGGR